MPTPIKAIIFDFGGVLLGWDPRHLYRRFFPNQPDAMELFLTEINFADWNAQQDKGRPFAEAVESLSAEFPPYADLIRAYDTHWEESLTGAIDGTVDILKQLKAMEYPLYGLSNWSGETFQRARHKYDFFNLFDDMVISGEVRMIKPEPEIFHHALQKFGRSASECIYIDDSLPNIIQAQKLGFIAIHFQSPEQLRVELQRLAII